MKNETCDVAVIGAGVFGAWTAYELQRSGKRVILMTVTAPGTAAPVPGANRA